MKTAVKTGVTTVECHSPYASFPGLPRYLPAAMAEAARIAGKPGLHHITVLHDDWCQLLKGTGPCNCHPEVEPAVSHAEWKRGQQHG